MNVDYRLAFDLAPVGLVLSRNRAIVDCNPHVCEMFGAARDQLMGGLTSKEIGRALSISHRTVEVYRARLMRKYKASTTADLVPKLLAG